MLLLVTTPASAMMPMPVITMPKGWPITSRPMITPIVDRMIADRIRKTLDSLLNWASSTTKIRKIATPKALPRNSCAAWLSSSSPASFQVTMPLKSASSSIALTCCWTAADCTPSATLAVTVTMRRPSMRLMTPTLRAATRMTKLLIGTEPAGVSM